MNLDPVLGAIIIAIITAILSPLAVKWYEKKRDNDPQNGWKAAVAALEKQVKDLNTRVTEQEHEIQTLQVDLRTSRDAAHQKDLLIAEKDRIIGSQSRAIIARDARIAQLTRAWPDGASFPHADPAFAQDL
jgi:predicted RNase H-like nuclease (RuvC/YqgF family)